MELTFSVSLRSTSPARGIASCIFLLKFMVYLFCGLARPLTPDQQDGVGEKPLLLLQKNLFFQTLCRQAGKTALYPECPAAKKLRTTLALPLKSLWVQKKSPPGWASSTNRCRKLWRCLTAQRGGNAAALPGKAGVNQPTNGRSVLAGGFGQDGQSLGDHKLKSRGKRNIE